MIGDRQPVTHGAFTIPSLDGLRAIAVLTVFVGHTALIGGPWPGHVGVTIFFFLSGYLITTLLRREYERTGTIRLSKFYLRRALRILPPAYLAVPTSFLLGAAGVIASTTTVQGIFAALFSYTNYYIAVHGREGLPPGTTLFWSLAVEEHYYLLVPAFLLLLLRRRISRQQIGTSLLALAAVVPVWRVYLGLTGAGYDRIYVSTDTRIDCLLYGSAMALLMNPALGDHLPFSERTRLRIVPIATLIFIATTLVPGFAFLLSIADVIQCACLVPIFWFIITQRDGRTYRLLNSSIMVRIGVLSFSIYLFHRMALEVCAAFIHVSVLADALALVLSIGVAQVVYWVVERPAGRLGKRLEAVVPSRAVRAVGR